MVSGSGLLLAKYRTPEILSVDETGGSVYESRY